MLQTDKDLGRRSIELQPLFDELEISVVSIVLLVMAVVVVNQIMIAANFAINIFACWCFVSGECDWVCHRNSFKVIIGFGFDLLSIVKILFKYNPKFLQYLS